MLPTDWILALLELYSDAYCLHIELAHVLLRIQELYSVGTWEDHGFLIHAMNESGQTQVGRPASSVVCATDVTNRFFNQNV